MAESKQERIYRLLCEKAKSVNNGDMTLVIKVRDGVIICIETIMVKEIYF
jgi:20S proteasome alpha/beta subunit